MTSSASTPGFDGRAVLVTGASGGLGRAICRALLDRGARVAGLDLAPAQDATVAFECDSSDPAAVREATHAAREQLGPLGLLVCAAGAVSEATIADLELAEWRRIVDASLTSAFVVAGAVAEDVVAASGAVVTLSSGWATKGYPRGAHYASAKAGVEALTKSLALEIAPGARANCLALGPFRTSMIDHIPAEVLAARTAQIPLQRIGEPDDVVGPVLFLLSDESRYITGQVIQVNGGLLMP